MINYELPTTADLIRLGDPQSPALSIYISTSPTTEGRTLAATSAKSAVDSAIRSLKEAGHSEKIQKQLRNQWASIAEDHDLWGRLKNALVIFLSPKVAEEYVLPNSLDDRTTLGTHFDISQLVRAVTAPQQAHALTISSSAWALWQATETSRAAELELAGDHAADAADATNRDTISGRQHKRRIVGDEGQKVLLEQYAKVVADAVRSELHRLDPNALQPLFIFGNEPLVSMIQDQGLPWHQVVVPGAADELKPDQVDAAIRQRIGAVASSLLNQRIGAIGDGFAAGLAVTDIAELGRATAAGAVKTLYYNLSTQLRGTFDEKTGDVSLNDDGDDLLSQMAVSILRSNGDVFAIRAEEAGAEIWNGRFLAQLRYSLA